MKLTPEDQKKLQDKELANIIRKLNSGKTLTAREEAKLAAASAGGQIDASGYVGTWDELATRLGVSRRAIQDWRTDPRYKDEITGRWGRLTRADGRYCVAEWLQLMIDLQLKRGQAAAEAENAPENAGELDEEGILRPPRVGGRKAEWDLAIAALDHRKKENAVLSLEGTLLVATELEVPLGATLAAIQTKLSQFPARVARYLVGLRDVGEVEDKLRDEIDADLADLQAAHYTAEEAIALAVAAVPFDDETKALCEKLLFAGSDRTALLQLAAALATQALRLVGQRAIANGRSEDPSTSDLSSPDTADQKPQPESASPPPPESGPPSAAKSCETSRRNDRGATRSTRKRPKAAAKRKARPKPTPPPAEMEGAIHKATPRQRR